MPEPLPILQFNTIRLSHAHAGLFISEALERDCRDIGGVVFSKV
jgi:hypothetical protein